MLSFKLPVTAARKDLGGGRQAVVGASEAPPAGADGGQLLPPAREPGAPHGGALNIRSLLLQEKERKPPQGVRRRVSLRGGSLICYFAVMVSEPKPNNERPYPLSTNNHKRDRPLLWEVIGDIRSAVARLQKLFRCVESRSRGV